MRVLICPDKFAGTLTAPRAAAAIAEGWRGAAAEDEVTVLPLSDGGPGMIDALGTVLSGRRTSVEVFDPLGRAVSADYLMVGDIAYIESAEACGLHLLSPDERDPLRTTSFGLGQLMAAAVEAGARSLVIGLGGSATNDAGAGMLTAVGLTPLDRAGHALPYGAAGLADCVTLEGRALLRGANLIAATDVDNPLCGISGASAVFGPQKGADDNDIQILDHALTGFGRALTAIPGCPPAVATLPGAGAAGGLGAALFALGARRESGAGLIGRALGLEAALDACDLVITGEGSFDHQSLSGKLVSGIASAATARGLPCAVLAGRVTVGRRDALNAGVTRALSLTDHYGSCDTAMTYPAEGLSVLGEKLANIWHRR